MRSFLIILIIAFILQSCLSASRKTRKSSTPVYDMPTLPYTALEKNKLDTTFDYDILHKDISFKLPDTILNGRINGAAELYVLIDQNKVVQEIELIECSLFDKKTAIYKFPDPLKEQQELKPKLEQFLLQSLRTIHFKQTKAPEIGLHKTYCFVRLYK